MKKIRIGVLGPSNIALRRTIPAMVKSTLFEYVGVACASSEEWGTIDSASIIAAERDKCLRFKELFGGDVFDSYKNLLLNNSIDAVYIPLPPGLHKKWAEEALKFGKHVLLEKPLTNSESDSRHLIELAQLKELVLHENYAFLYHKQISELDRIVKTKMIGDLRFIRASFSFPYRGEGDFRYHKSMGGGALSDCAGYPLKLASRYLDSSFVLDEKALYSSRDHDVDVYGSATLRDEHISAQIFWGMDNVYRCNIELYGSIGFAKTERVYSPTAEMETVIDLMIEGKGSQIVVRPDDQFLNSLDFFGKCILNENEEDYDAIVCQARLIDSIRGM